MMNECVYSKPQSSHGDVLSRLFGTDIGYRKLKSLKASGSAVEKNGSKPGNDSQNLESKLQKVE